MHTRLIGAALRVIKGAKDRVKANSGPCGEDAAVYGGCGIGMVTGLITGVAYGNSISDQTPTLLRTTSRVSLATSGTVLGGVTGVATLAGGLNLLHNANVAFPRSTKLVAVASLLGLSSYGLFNQERRKETNEKTKENNIISLKNN
jgi:hypothetical protein